MKVSNISAHTNPFPITNEKLQNYKKMFVFFDVFHVAMTEVQQETWLLK